MALFKCKMCGGDLELHENQSIATCEYCGTQQTLPKLSDDRRANLYDRANHFRRNNDFDKAMGIYNQILNDDTTDAEAYWSLVLCRYGIEYVEDPATHKRVPTVNRAQFTSIFADEDYKSAIANADTAQKTVYEAEAKAIDEIQKGILAISQKEEPFDVFICYKETDNNGRRTPDSVLANDLYHQLTQEGFKVFFARITLEDKLGTAYEPYIFAALNSAKVMVVLGTKPEYFKAVWVKNEWSRYLALIKNGAKKILIPAYKDMDPYDLPEEFSHLQGQDMSKLGFMQDLIRGIKKLTHTETPAATVVKETVINATGINTAPLLKRAFMFLEDGDWSAASEYCEKVLDIDPECAQAYVGKLMAELKVRIQEKLKDCEKPFDNLNNYKKAVRFADSELKETLTSYIDHIYNRNAEYVYELAITQMRQAVNREGYTFAAEYFDSIPHYKDASVLAQQCRENAANAQFEGIYKCAKLCMEQASNETGYINAAQLFKSISQYRDSAELAQLCSEYAEEQRKEEEKKRVEEERRRTEEKKKRIEEVRRRTEEKKKRVEEERRRKEEEQKRAEEERRRKEEEQKAVMLYKGYKAAIRIESIQNKIAALDKERTSLGLFSIKRKKEIADRIHILKMNMQRIMEDKTVSLPCAGTSQAVREELNNLDLGRKLLQRIDGMKNIKKGEYIIFGSYEQDNNTANGKEEIEWLVLEVNDKKALVVSKYALDCKKYNLNHTDSTWETCFLRSWLNKDFINSAFSADEKSMIPTVTVSADKNPKHSTNPGNATQDQVFLLSITEVKKYIGAPETLECKPTAYAVAKGAEKDRRDNCNWWLRTIGERQTTADVVDCDGDVRESGFGVHATDVAVRPALWIDLNS